MTLTPVDITFRHMPSSDAVQTCIQEEAAQLERYYGRITSCHVVVESPHHHHRPQGRTWLVRIHLNVPGKVVIVDHEPSFHAQAGDVAGGTMRKHDEPRADHRDIYVCIRDAFSAARRQLEDYSRKLRGDVKCHAESLA